MNTDFAYLAGIIDGEGCFYIAKNKSRHKGLPVYTVKLKVTMTHFPTINKIQEIFPATSFYRETKPKKTRKPSLVWIANGTRLKMLIPLIEPFLICKKIELKIVKEFLSLPKGNWSKKPDVWVIEKREWCYNELKQAKKYRFDEDLVLKPIKKLKCNSYNYCPICNRLMNIYSDGSGIKLKSCSETCASRKFNDYQEQQIVSLFKEKGIKRVCEIYNCKDKLVYAIIDRFKKRPIIKNEDFIHEFII